MFSRIAQSTRALFSYPKGSDQALEETPAAQQARTELADAAAAAMATTRSKDTPDSSLVEGLTSEIDAGMGRKRKSVNTENITEEDSAPVGGKRRRLSGEQSAAQYEALGTAAAEDEVPMVLYCQQSDDFQELAIRSNGPLVQETQGGAEEVATDGTADHAPFTSKPLAEELIQETQEDAEHSDTEDTMEHPPHTSERQAEILVQETQNATEVTAIDSTPQVPVVVKEIVQETQNTAEVTVADSTPQVPSVAEAQGTTTMREDDTLAGMRQKSSTRQQSAVVIEKTGPPSSPRERQNRPTVTVESTLVTQKPKHKRFDSEESSIPETQMADDSVHCSGLSGAMVIDEAEKEDNSDDEAPEIVTAVVGHDKARSTAAEAANAAKRQSQAEKELRRRRDAQLKKQSKISQKEKVKHAKNTEKARQGPEDLIAKALLSSGPLPAVLPDEILAAEPTLRMPIPPREIQKPNMPNKHKYLQADPKQPKDVQRGDRTVRVLQNTTTVLPPKVSKKSQKIREDWLRGKRGRKGNMAEMRKPVNKSFIVK